MKCNECKKDIPDNSEFCPYCGKDLRKSDSPKTNDQDILNELDNIKANKIEQNNNTTKASTIQEPEKLICKKCNKELQPNFRRCPYCGSKIKEKKPKSNKDILNNKKLIIVLLGIIGVLLIVSTVFITLYFSSKTSDTTPYTTEIDSDGYTKYIYNTNSKIYHISEECVAAQRMKNKKVLWTNVDFIPGKPMEFYDESYEPCQICAY